MPPARPSYAVGCATILRGSGGDAIPHVAGSGALTPGDRQQKAKLSAAIDRGKVVATAAVPPKARTTELLHEILELSPGSRRTLRDEGLSRVELADLDDHLSHALIPAGAPRYAWARERLLTRRDRHVLFPQPAMQSL